MTSRLNASPASEDTESRQRLQQHALLVGQVRYQRVRQLVDGVPKPIDRVRLRDR
jgi:hypothetical protein